MKKIIFSTALMALAMTIVACDPAVDNDGPQSSAKSEELTNQLHIDAKSPGNNNLTVYTTPSRFIWVYDAATDNVVGSGTSVNIQIAPPQTEANFYVTTRNQDGTTAKSGSKSVTISEYTDLPEIYNQIFGDGNLVDDGFGGLFGASISVRVANIGLSLLDALKLILHLLY